MPRRPASGKVLRLLWARLAFQFAPEVADYMLKGKIEVSTGSGGRVRHVWKNGEPYLTLRPNDGYFSLSLRAGEDLRKAVGPPRFRVVVRRGAKVVGSVFPSQVAGGDHGLRPGDEAIVVDEDDRLVAVGRVRIPLWFIKGLDRGEVVRLR